jgi:hypothetical protein
VAPARAYPATASISPGCAPVMPGSGSAPPAPVVMNAEVWKMSDWNAMGVSYRPHRLIDPGNSCEPSECQLMIRTMDSVLAASDIGVQSLRRIPGPLPL